jgi:oligosaccharide repeat unit polymerase
MSFIFFLLAILSLCFYYYYNQDIFNPCSIFLVIWFLTCGISCVDYDDYMAPWCFQMYVVTLLSGVSFWIGSLIYLRKKKFSKLKKTELGSELKFVIYLLFFICFSAMILEWLNGGTHLNLVSTTTTDVYDQKNELDGDIAGVHYGTIFLPFVAILLYFKILTTVKVKKIDWFLIITIILSSVFIKLSRGDLIIYMVSFVFLYSRYSKINIKVLLLCAVGFASMFIGVMIYRLDETSIVFASTSNPYISVFYSYIATCFANLNDYIRLDNGLHLFGNATFAPLWTLTGLKETLEVTSIKQMEIFNASVYIYGFYHDFNIFGIIFFPFLIGVFLSKIYYNVLLKSSIWVILLAVLQKAIYVSFFGNYFFGELVILYPYILTSTIIFLQLSLKDIRSLFKNPIRT